MADEAIRLHSYDEAAEFLPEERKARLIKEIEAIREKLQGVLSAEAHTELETALRQREAELEKLGGDTRQRTIEVLERYDPETDSQWFEQCYGGIEKEYFTNLLHTITARFDIPVSKVVVNDRGMGTGRSLKMLMDLVKQQYGAEAATGFAQHLGGIDLMSAKAEAAQEALKSSGVPFRNLTTGNFLNPPHQEMPFAPGTVHLIISMMHSAFHCLTEEDWKRFFEHIEYDLVEPTSTNPGGIVLLDTVAMDRSAPGSIREKDLKKLNDLKNLYSFLWYRSCEENQPFCPEGIDLRRMPRRPIRDNTTGQGFYWREVPDHSFIKYILKKYHINLRLAHSPLKAVDICDPVIQSEEAKVLGRKWIRENDLENVYRVIIQERIEKKIVNPSALLRGKLQGRKIPSEPGALLEAILDYVAIRMVRGYGNEYIQLERIRPGGSR